MNENEKKLNLDDLLDEFLAGFGTGNEKILDEYTKDYPEFEQDLREAAAYSTMTKRIPNRQYTQEEEELLTSRATSVMQNLLSPLKQAQLSSHQERVQVEDTSQLSDLVEEIEKRWGSVDAFAAKTRFSDIVVYVFSNREVRPGSIPRKAYEAFSNMLQVGFENIQNYALQSLNLQPSHLKSEGKPEFKSQMEFSDLIDKDPFMKDEDKEYWLSFTPIEKE